MNNPILQVTSAGFGETPIPEDAQFQIGDRVTVFEARNEPRLSGAIHAVVPAGVSPEYAMADQHEQPRPLMMTRNRKRKTTYIVALDRDADLDPRPVNWIAGEHLKSEDR